MIGMPKILRPMQKGKRRFKFEFYVDLDAVGRYGDKHEGAEPPEDALATNLSYILRRYEAGDNEPTALDIEFYRIKYDEVIE